MMERISPVQLMTLLVVSRLTLTLVYFSGDPDAKQDTWWLALFGAGATVLVAWLLNHLWQRFPGRTLAEIFLLVLGPLAGRLLVALYVVVLLLFFSLALRLTSEVFIYNFLPRTPQMVLLIILGILAAWGAKAGIEVTARAAQVVFPLLIVAVLSIVFLVLRNFEWRDLYPPQLLVTGPVPHLREMLNISLRAVELIWIGLLFPLVTERRKVMRAVTVAHLWLGLLWLGKSLATYGVLGRDVAAYNFPFLTVARIVDVADFLQRLEGPLLMVWMLGMILRAAALLWGAAVATASGMGLRQYRPLVIPLAAVGTIYAMLQAESLSALLHFLRPETLTPFGATFVLLIPLLVLAVAALRGLREDGALAARTADAPGSD